MAANEAPSLAAPRTTTGPGPGFGVVVVMRRLYENGGVRSTLRLVQQWSRAGVDVHLVALEHTRGVNAAPIPPDVLPEHPARPGTRRRYVLASGLWHVVRRALRADVVVAGQHHGAGLLVARVAASLTRRPFVTVVRSAPDLAIQRWVPPRLRAVTRAVHRSADRVVCITPGLVSAVHELGVRPERVAVALNGVEVERIAAAGSAPPPALPSGPGALVLGVGRLEGQKGFDVLVRAHAQVVAGGQPHRLLILGEGPDRAALEALAAELGVSGSVHLPGFADDPLPTMAAADLYCLPSRYEGFGQSLAEAMILGTPTVAADCVSGPRLLLADGAHGDLVPVDDVDALAAAIAAHLRDPDRLRAAAARGRVWAVEHLSIERAATDLLAVLADVGASRRRRGGRGA
ncbi:MAG: hypothetical protein AVDCRST_MAG35-2653 [uncultured Quadrisphaera sp.]|uniref:Glycosyl transferase, group 1 n=1 Tax=uncultured Quadrisphaera sp. TaxID=904978 RepID=A0A6J4Q683_9ACTN|nr:MAG: hypothetical protein AVDCRST_MAG35-2653 [uncultured Quadrisphaera sp.]